MRLFLTLRKFGFQAASNVQSFHLLTVLSAKRIAFTLCLLASFSQQLAAQPWLNPNLTYGSVNDVDGNPYPTIQIGNQLWMAENLRTTRFSNGDAILNQTNFNLWNGQPGPGVTPQWCFYQNNGAYNVPFGKMYNWYVAADSRNVCPVGWHVPSIAEWYEMFTFIDSTVAPSTTYFIEHPNLGGQLKSTGTQPGINTYWNAPNTGATNEFGFSALGAGYSENSGLYQGTRMWSTTGDIIAPDGCAQIVQFNNNDALTEVVGCDFGYKTSAGSIRCVKAVNNRCDFGIPFIYPPCINEFYICPGDTTPTLQTFVEYTSPDIDYQWYSIDGLPIVGATSNQYTPDTFNSLGSYQYYLIVNPNTECSAISEIFTINVVDGSQFVGYATDHTICEGFTVTLAPNVNYQGGTCQWSNGSDFPFQTFEATESVTLGFNYSIGSCINYADSITLTVIPKPTVNIQSNVDCQTGEVTLTAVADTPGGTYRWRTGEVTNEITVTQQLGSFQSVEYETFGCSAIGTNCFDDAIIKYFDHSDNGIFCINDYLTLFCDCNGQDYAELNTFVIGVAGNFAGIEGACSEALRNIATDTVQISINSLSVCGCTDPSASNYNPSATVDDGSCIFNSCFNLDIIAIQEPCLYVSSGELLPSARIYTIYDGNCTVDSLFVIDNTADTTLAFDVFGTSGSFQLLNGFDVFSNYGIYYMLDDGSVSPIFDFTTTDCSNDPTLCDCDQNVHSIGVYTWLGDSYADDGAFLWQGETVNFNCATWGYDCGDIFGAPSNDPFGVCSGNLPPNNGCSDALTVSATDITVECDAVLYPENYPISVIGACTADYTLTFTDQTIAGITGSCDYTVIRTWNVTDACGNQASTSSTIYFIDTTPPEFVFYPPDMELDCSDAIPAFQPFVFENCGDYFLTLTEEYIPTGVCQEWFDVVRIAEVYDECGNFNSDTITYYIRDYTAPLFFNNGPSTFFVPYGEPFVTPTPQVFDDCSSYFLSSVNQPNIFDLCGSYSVIWTATDQCNNASTFTQNVVVSGPTLEFIPCDDFNDCTIDDHISPDCVCLGTYVCTDTLFGCTDPLATNYNPNATIDDGSCTYGTCSNYQLTFTPRPCEFNPNIGDVSPAFNVSYSYNGTCNVDQVVVLDEFGLPNPFATNATSDSSGGFFNFIYLLPETTYGVYLIMSDGSISPTFNYTTGTCGGTICDCNGTQHTESVTLWLGDNFADAGGFSLNGQPVDFNCATWGYDCGDILGTPSDDPYGVCDGNLPPNNGCSDPLTVTAWDITVECADLLNSDNYPITVTGACNSFYTVDYIDDFDITDSTASACEYTRFRLWIVTDSCGNQATAISTIYFIDNVAPQFINFPVDMELDCNDPLPVFQPLVNENCGQFYMTLTEEYIPSGVCQYWYDVVRVAEVIDDCGNFNSDTVTYTIRDYTAPLFFGNGPSTFFVPYGEQVVTPTPQVVDDCSDFILSSVNQPNSFDLCGSYSVIWTATDQCNNASTFTQNVVVSGPTLEFVPCDDNDICTVNDHISPDCTCEGELFDNNFNGICDYDEGTLNVTAQNDIINCTYDVDDLNYLLSVSGGCGNYSIFYIDEYDTDFPNPCDYSFTRIWSVTDGCGNTGFAQSLITVYDNYPPQFTYVPSGGFVECVDYLFFETPIAADNCDPFIDITASQETIYSGVCPNDFILRRTYTAIDDCFNTVTAFTDYIVSDTVAPIFDFNTPLSYNIPYGSNFQLPTPTAFDNCFGEVIVYQEEPVDISTLCGTNEVTWIALDACGNTNTFTQTINIVPLNGFNPIPCDDNNGCTIDDQIGPDCVCQGTYVCTDIIVTQQPQSAIVCATQSVTLSVAATGSNLRYQWYYNGNPIFGAVNSTYVLNSVDLTNAGTYYVEIYNELLTSNSVNSNSASIELNEACNSIVVTASGCNGPTFSLSGEIQLYNPPATGTLTITSSCGFSQEFASPFPSTINFLLTRDATTFPVFCSLDAVFSAAGSPTIQSTSFLLDACCSDTPAYLAQNVPSTASACINSSDVELEIVVIGGPYTVQWYSATNPLGPFNPLSNETGTTYTPPATVVGTTYYNCIVTTFDCGVRYINSNTCAFTVTNSSNTPSFGTFGPYCAGSIIPPLPTSSTNGIQGEWSPAINNQTTTTYTFTPNNGQCASSVTRTITITPGTTPSFDTFGPYCADSSIPALPTTSNNGIQGEWSPAINNQSTTTYTFTPNAGQCAGSVTLVIEIIPGTTPSFGTFGPYCADSSIPALPTTSNNGIQGEWSPAINNQTTTTYTFTPNTGQCAGSVTTTIEITPGTTPSFGTFGPYCAGSSIPALPTISTNGIQGEWSPAINNQSTTTYTFTPNTGQCAGSVTTTIEITPGTTPSFGTFGPYCVGSSIPALPTISTNGIQGEWSPAINNQTTTTYTFTPNTGQCAATTTLVIEITQPAVPTFSTPSPYCQSSAFPPLPNTSNNGISGAWAPTVNNQTTTTYTFTPDGGQCATSVDMTITILPSVTPQFTILDAYCAGASIPALPTTSNNNVTGSWSPSINNQTTTAYVFTPDAGQCATVATQTITVGDAVTAMITNLSNSNELSCNINTIALAASGAPNVEWSGGLGNSSIVSVTEPGTYTVTVSDNLGCSDSESITITQNNDAPTAAIINDSGTAELSCSVTSISLTATGGDTYSWSDGLGSSPSVTVTQAGTYTVTVTQGNCSAEASISITTSNSGGNANAGIDGAVSLCNTGGPSNLFDALGGTPQNGGAWSGPGGTLNGGIYNPQNNQPGVYSYIIQNACGSDTAYVSVEEENAIQALIDYDSPLCMNISEYVAPALLSPNGGTFSVSPTTGLSINAAGAINPFLSVPGTYSVNYSIDGACTTENSTLVIIEAMPIATVQSSGSILCPNESIVLTASGGETYLWSNGSTGNSIVISEPGTYDVIATNDAGCVDTSNVVNILEGSVPNAIINPEGPVSVCPGQSVTLSSGSVGTSYLWSTGATTSSITTNQVGDYWLVLTSASGCRDTSDTVTVDNENGAGTVILPQGPLVVCEGDSLILTASPADQVYLWSTGESAQSITITAAGTYNVTTINDLGCAGEASVEVTSAPYPNSCTIPDIYGCGSASDEFTFCAPTADEYAWTSSNDAAFLETDFCITVTPTSTVTYTLMMTNAGACSTMCDVTVSLEILCFIDNDGDTWGGQQDSTFAACDCPTGWTPIPNDCNDNNPSVNPAVNSEICFDGLDNNCSDGIDEGCESQVLGCMYPDACNFNPDATQDDGSCLFINGCTDPNACNFQENACIDNGSCLFPGCMNELACNYDPAAGCDNDSCEFMVTSDIVEPDSVSANDTVTFYYTGEPGDIYLWEVEDGTIVGAATEDSMQVYWPFPGQNEVSLIIQNGEFCSDTLTITVTVEADPSAILELNALSLEVYPNPTTNDFMLKVSSESLGGLVEVFDAIGRVVHQETLTQIQTQIDSEQWAAGVYTLRIVKDKRTATLRVIKE